MRKSIVFLLAALLLLSLVACGGKSETSSVSESAPSAAQPDDAPPGSVAAPAVDIQGDSVIARSNDGMGTDTVTEYRYKDGALAWITMTFEYGDSATASNVYNEMKSGSLKQTADASYADFHLDGKAIVCTMNDGQVAAFSSMSQDELAAFLKGEAPSGETLSSESAGEIVPAETAINTNWESLTLPEGFPKLADGVTEYSAMEGGYYSLSWNAMSQSDAVAMIGKLEDWIGTPGERMEMDGAISWTADSGAYNVSLNYYSDTFGGAMPQVLISLMQFE